MPDPTPRSRSNTFWVFAVLVALLLLLVSWFTRFPWDYIQVPGP
jgi:hypothetical protein